MINFEKGTIKAHDTLPEELIIRWEVWWVCVLGTFNKLQDAIDSCKETGQPAYSLIPIPVAIGATQYEIVCRL